MSNKIDITSTALEKGIDLAKDFLDKLIIPSIEETGLLLKDKVTFWKFKNQIRMLNKAKKYCDKQNIDPKTISLKLLCPLLEYSSLEEEEELQDKWAILLANMVDSKQNIENHVFPYILSQISLNEFKFLESSYDEKIIRQRDLTEELNQFKREIPHLLHEITNQIEELTNKINALRIEVGNKWSRDLWNLERELNNLKEEPKNIERKEISLIYKISSPQIIPDQELKEFELSNLLRLGLVRHVQRHFADTQTLEIPYENDPEYSGRTTYTNIDLDIDIISEEEYVITELGEMFISACKMN